MYCRPFSPGLKVKFLVWVCAGGAIEGDASVVLALEVGAPIDELLDAVHGLIDEDLCELLVGEESAEGDEIAHRRHVGVAVLLVEADDGAGADVQRTSGVPILALDDHGHAGSVVARLDGGPQSRAAAADDENVGRYGLVHLMSAPVLPLV